MEPGLNIETGAIGGGSLFATFISWWLKALHGDYRNFKLTVFNRIDEIKTEQKRHEVEDARLYATRDDLQDIREFMDRKFTEQTNMIIGVIQRAQTAKD